MKQTFTKDERLCKKILIAKLFKEGTSFYSYPFRVSYLDSVFPGEYPVQLLISVPKHNIRKAVNRNTIKRRIREAYRRNKEMLYTPLTESRRQMILAVTYTPKEILSYQLIREKIILLLLRLREGHAQTFG